MNLTPYFERLYVTKILRFVEFESKLNSPQDVKVQYAQLVGPESKEAGKRETPHCTEPNLRLGSRKPHKT